MEIIIRINTDEICKGDYYKERLNELEEAKTFILVKLMDLQIGPWKEIHEMKRFAQVKDKGNYVRINKIIHNLEKRKGLTIPINDILIEAKKRGIKEEKEVENVLTNYKKSGIIYELEGGLVQRI